MINFNLLIKKWSKKDQNQSILFKIRLKLDQNHDCRYDLIAKIRIRPKSTIKIGRLGIRIVDDLILEAKPH